MKSCLELCLRSGQVKSGDTGGDLKIIFRLPSEKGSTLK